MVDLTEARERLRRERTEALVGVLPALLRLLELQLARPVTREERAALLRRLDPDGAPAVSDALVSLDPVAIAVWLSSTG